MTDPKPLTPFSKLQCAFIALTYDECKGTGINKPWNFENTFFDSTEAEQAFATTANQYDNFVQVAFSPTKEQAHPTLSFLTTLTTKCSYITSLAFMQFRLNPTTFDPFFESLSKDTKITELMLFIVEMEESTEAALGEGLATNKGILELSIRSSKCPTGFNSVVRAVGTNDTMTSLRITNTIPSWPLEDDFGATFVKNKTLTSLNLGGNWDCYQVVRRFCDVIAQNRTLTCLFIPHNIKFDFMMPERTELSNEFARALKANQTLIQLDMSDWGIWFDIDPILAVIPDTRLQHVNLRHNANSYSVETFLQMIRTSGTLKELFVPLQRYTGTVKDAVLCAINHNPVLTHISIPEARVIMRRNNRNQKARNKTLAGKAFRRYTEHVKGRYVSTKRPYN